MKNKTEHIQELLVNLHKRADLSSKQRVALIHKGNYAFNQEQYELAEKIFVTANYHDGLVRIGEHHMKGGCYFQAAEIFRRAKYLKGEYQCYLKLGLVSDMPDFHNKKSFKAINYDINKKMAKVIQAMLFQGDANPNEEKPIQG